MIKLTHNNTAKEIKMKAVKIHTINFFEGLQNGQEVIGKLTFTMSEIDSQNYSIEIKKGDRAVDIIESCDFNNKGKALQKMQLEIERYTNKFSAKNILR